MITASNRRDGRKYRGASRSRFTLEARESNHERQDARVLAGGMKLEVVERHRDKVIKVLLKAVRTGRSDHTSERGESLRRECAEQEGYAPTEEIPVLLELAAEPSPVAVRLRFALHDDSCERGRIVGKDVAGVEQFLVEELNAGKARQCQLIAPRR